MKIVMPENQQAIYRVRGSIAALVKEEVWEKLLNGEVVGVIEPDPERYSLFINGSFVKSFQAPLNEQRVNIKGERGAREWQALHPGAEIQQVEVVPGYPNMIELPREKAAAYLAHGLNSRICAEKVREFVTAACGRVDSFMGVFTFMEQVANGMTREGRD